MSEDLQEVVPVEVEGETGVELLSKADKKPKKEKKDKKEKKAEKKRLKDLENSMETAVPGPKDRYKVLMDLLKMNNDISEMAEIGRAHV